ncbi:hypothetical protein BBJ28_00025087 [Nothophytophthora sp. Chile5]|nr:hypothetical protein BBJ28_00025087 [Nothophytophthora sp. Chile5]
MNYWRVFITALSFVCVLLAESVSAWYGVVTFYNDVWHEGQEFPWGIAVTQKCYNLSCFNKKASSVKWEGLPEKGSFDGKSRIAFFIGKECTGTSRDWPADGFINNKKKNYPLDFALDGINDAISSFMIWETSKKINNGNDLPCPWGTN